MSQDNNKKAEEKKSEENKSDEVSKRCILVTGAAGQIGTELLIELRKRHGNNNVIGIGRKTKPSSMINKRAPGPFIMNVDICNINDLETKVFKKYPKVDTIYHLAAILSGVGEKKPQLCWEVNMTGSINIFELCRKYGCKNVFIPSSVGAFGPNAPKKATQTCGMNPTTMYGITKVSMELLMEYYSNKYSMKIRGVRLPGIISYEAMPGGGTTDYAVQIFYDALDSGKYTCFIEENTAMPFLYMPDCIELMIKLMEYKGKLTRNSDFNVTGFSFTPKMLIKCIKKHIPNLSVTFKPDFRQKIAESWPDDMIDDEARKQWGYKPKFTLDKMVEDMIKQLKERKQKTGSLYPSNDDDNTGDKSKKDDKNKKNDDKIETKDETKDEKK